MTANVTIVQPGGEGEEGGEGEQTPSPGMGQLPEAALAATRAALGDATVWHVNSTATGGGIAELLHSSIGWHERAGVRARWMVVSGSPEYFALTKQLHDMLHGLDAPGSRPGPAERALYARTTAAQARAALDVIRPGDVVVLHDPQPLGMAPILSDAGARVIWRTHIGTRRRDQQVDDGWQFLRPFLAGCRRFVFSARAYAPAFVPPDRTVVVHPSIDPGSAKCADLDDGTVTQIMRNIGLQFPDPPPSAASADAAAADAAAVRIVQDRPVPAGAEMILQVARWDRLKDIPGTLTAYARYIAPMTQAELVLAGPDPADIPDDPVGRRIFEEVVRQRQALAPAVRARIHLAVLGLRDQLGNARIVNALQRRATVVTQKSLEEGFGLAVTEAMWKRRGVVASAVGGITEQITDHLHGLLVPDPRDLRRFADEVCTLLHDPVLRSRLAEAGHAVVAERFLAGRELSDYARLYREVAA
jgi:trehalose synthase